MKVYRIDTENGLQETLTENELVGRYSEEEIETFKNEDNTYFYETHYTVRQLNRARKLKKDDEWCDKFEDEFGYIPNVGDILNYLYG